MSLAAGTYSRRRMGSIAVVAVSAAGIAFVLGFPRVGWGALAATPVGLFNYYLMYAAARRFADGDDNGKDLQMRLLKRTLVRMAISMAALVGALRFGPEFLIGVLIGVVAEMTTYMGDAAQLIFSRRR